MARPIRFLMVAVGALCLGLIAVVCIRAANPGPRPQPAVPVDEANQFPYRSPKFTQFLTESDLWCKPSETRDFYSWMDRAYAQCNYRFPGKESLSLDELLKAKREQFDRIENPVLRAETEVAFSAWVHRMVKTVIPRFNLNRGFEFCNVVRYGERQCFLQSVLIAGVLQAVGFDAGVVMVYRNPKGEESNNGHAVVLLKLSDQRDILVDASAAEPFYKPRGVFVRDSEYRFVSPEFVKDSARIRCYVIHSGARALSTEQVRPLDYAFVRSQFWYYRGERAKGAFVYAKPTSEGWSEARKALEQSAKYSPKNPLAVYMLGRVYHAQGNKAQAKTTFQTAYDLYTRFGWTPPDVRKYRDLTARM